MVRRVTCYPDNASLPELDPWQVVAAVGPCLRIVHHIAGRIRLKLDTALDGASLQVLGGQRLKTALTSVRGVNGISLNLLARSCTVEYNPAVIPDAAWPDLLAQRQTAAARTLVGILQERYEEVRNGQP